MRQSHTWTDKDILFVYLKGKNPYEIGYEQGRLLKTEVESEVEWIKKFFNLFLTPLFGPLTFRVLECFSKKLSERFSKESIEEIRGMADGSGQKFKTAILANTIFDITSKIPNFLNANFCSGFLTYLEKSNEVIMGKNSDVSPQNAELFANHKAMIIYDCKWLENKYLTPSYGLALIGDSFIFENGLSIGFMGGGFTYVARYDLKKTFFSELVKRLTRADGNISKTIKILKKQKPMKPFVPIVTDGTKKNSFAFEVSSSKYQKHHLRKMNDCLVQTNHLLCQDLIDDHYRKKYSKDHHYLGSVWRQKNIEKEVKKITNLKEATRILEIHEKTMDQNKGSISNLGTVHSFVYSAKQKKLLIANGRKAPVAFSGKWVEFNLDDIFNHKSFSS
ncbi:MAG: hypothetical protein JW991_01070 [Candidatus Pacebacteria bacterium]|nr:hypothetical protein [Candidatus Paceibacterota bacterium]